MILTLIFYATVCTIFYILWQKNNSKVETATKKYSRNEMESYSGTTKLPDD